MWNLTKVKNFWAEIKRAYMPFLSSFDTLFFLSPSPFMERKEKLYFPHLGLQYSVGDNQDCIYIGSPTILLTGLHFSGIENKEK